MPAALTDLRPMISVPDLGVAAAFYRDQLGFTPGATFGEPPTWCALSRDRFELMFTTFDHRTARLPYAGDGRSLYFDTNDVVGLHAEFRERGVACSDLRVTAYGMKEFDLRDPNGVELWFAQPTDEPPTGCE